MRSCLKPPIPVTNGMVTANPTQSRCVARQLPLDKFADGKALKRGVRVRGKLLTINVAVLLVIITVFRLRRRTQARSRLDEKFTVVIVLVLGVVIAPTALGESIFSIVDQFVHGLSNASR